MENIFVDLGDDLTFSSDSAAVIGEDNVLAESETLVGPPGPPGPRGERGEPGRDGVDGRNATITIGTTTTGQPGTNASVVNSGTESEAVLNFTIPRGATGIQGEQGVQGLPGQDGSAATITVGSVQTVAPEYPATVINSGTSSAAVLDFEIPRGQDGAVGPQGPAGSSATVTAGPTFTLPAGSSASVVNTGTLTNAEFTFSIPEGMPGADGQPGTPGFSPSASVTQTASGATISITDEQGTTTANITNGVDGADGVTPVIAATASVDSTTGSPSVSVSKTGTDENPQFDFAFTGLKGETGSTGPQGPAGPTSLTSLYVSAGNFSSVSFSGARVIQTMSVPAGLWRIVWGFRCAYVATASNKTEMCGSGILSGTDMTGTRLYTANINMTSASTGAAAGRAFLSGSMEVTLTATRSISSYIDPLMSGYSGGVVDNAWLYAFKIN